MGCIVAHPKKYHEYLAIKKGKFSFVYLGYLDMLLCKLILENRIQILNASEFFYRGYSQ